MGQKLFITQTISKKIPESMQIPEVASFLINSEIELKSRGLLNISWGYSTGEEDGYRHRDSHLLWVTGLRHATKEEVDAANKKIKDAKVEDIRNRISSIQKNISTIEEKVKNLKALSIRLKSEINQKESRAKDVENNEKGIARNEKELIEANIKLKKETPLLNLDDESLLVEWFKIYPHESLYLYEE